MKSRRVFLFILILLMLCCACSRAPRIESGAVLLSEGGDTLLFSEDYEFAVLYEELYAETYGGKASVGEELFTALAETALLTRLAELYGAAADADAVRADLELLLSDSDGQDAAFLKELRKASGLDSEVFADMYVKQAYMTESAALLTEDIASEYGNLPDGEAIREAVLNNIYEMVSHLSVSVGYPGLEEHTFTFEVIDSL